jgi:cytochrome c
MDIFSSGEPKIGAKLFKAKCSTCHTINEGGPNKQGPNLYKVI